MLCIKLSIFLANLITAFSKISSEKNADNFDEWACINKTNDNRRLVYMRWPDRMPKEAHQHAHDLWFDRMLYIHSEGNYDYINRRYNHKNLPPSRQEKGLSVTTNGVFISDNQVLTSLNPLRRNLQFAFTRHFTSICALNYRKYTARDDDRPGFKLKSYSVACARPVLPVDADSTPYDLWQGPLDNPRQHSPLHDLLVLRIEETETEFLQTHLEIDEYFKTQNLGQYLKAGPIKTVLAKKGERLRSDLKFAMMGHIISEDVRVRRNTYVDWFREGEAVEADCDEWLPRNWGWFICLHNLHLLPRLASGAMLFSGGTLFGIGSFTIYKGAKSIMAFTDVRQYEHLINKTCTPEDQS